MIQTFDAVLPHGITLSCRATGRPGQPVLLFAHGFPEAAFVWDELLEHFGDRYRCIAPNLRGYEKSSSPPEVEAYRVKHLQADLAALIPDTTTTGASCASLLAEMKSSPVASLITVMTRTGLAPLT